jgi:SagB-type dehydrogenase family enzyme
MALFTRRRFFGLIILLGAFGGRWFSPFKALSARPGGKEGDVMLPKIIHEDRLSVKDAIKRRRSVRSFSSRAVTKEDLSQLLYAAQGITEDKGFKRAAPSAGALYPLDIYAIVGEKGVEDLDAGVYHYSAPGHRIENVVTDDRKEQLAVASVQQMWMAKAPLNFVITAEYSRICSKYGERGIRYAMIEAGHVGQNIFLQAEALGLNAGIVGAFDDRKVIDVLGIPKKHEPLLIMPVGYRA